MKQKDLFLIIVVVIASGIISFLLSSILITTPKNRKAQVEVVNAITSQFNQPDKKYFNDQSVNLTKLIQIGDNQNPQPFNIGH